jgi:hypothetical protein
MTVEQAKSSVRQLEKICSIRPTVENLNNLVICYFTLNDLQAALPLAQLAFSKDPNDPNTSMNLGFILKDLGEHGKAHDCFKVAYQVADEKEYVRLAYSESLLRSGRWGGRHDTWPIYDSARASKEQSALTVGLSMNVKPWNGRQLVDELLVIDEGGIGDRITFCRWLPELTKKGISWKYFAFPELRGFFERASWCGPDRLIGVGSQATQSHWTTVVSLPANFNATPADVPELPEKFTVLPKLKAKYSLARTKLPVVGLCWRGDESKHGGRRVHSLTEGQAMRLVCKTDHLVHWVNLQHDHVMPKPVENVKFNSWEELAALISNLDAVVSVETGPMCLADALGKPLTVLLSSNSDWRFLESGQSPFYPNAKLVRNGPGGGLENAVDLAIEQLEAQYRKPMLHVVGG